MAETWCLKGHMLKVKYNSNFGQNTGLQKEMFTAYKQNSLWQITQDNETLHTKRWKEPVKTIEICLTVIFWYLTISLA